MIQSGRYSNCTFQYVMAKDKDYCGWVVQALHEKRPLPPDLQEFAALIKKQEGGIQRVGAYRNWFFRDIWRDQGYCRWAASLEQPGPGMERFSRYAAKMLGTPWPMPPKRSERSVMRKDAAPTPPPPRESPRRKKQRCDERFEETILRCIICMSKPREIAFKPCCHMLACKACGPRIKERSGRCPMCRGRIDGMLRIFTA